MTVSVITISDRAYNGVYDDLAGPEIHNIISKEYPDWSFTRVIVPDEEEKIREALERSLGSDYIITSGGTGISPRDITPEVTEKFCSKQLPGVAEYLRRESVKETLNAILSRGYAGIRDNTIIINFPGSVKAVQLCTRLLLPVMEHGIKMIAGGKH